MSNKHEKKLWEVINWLQVLLAILVISLLGIAYFTLARWLVIDDVWRGFLLNIISNLIPTFILFAGAYFLFRGVDELRSEKNADEVADKVVQKLIEIAKVQVATPGENNNSLNTPIKFSELYLKLSREFNITVKPFEAKLNPQKIIVECTYRGQSSIRIKKITYHGSKLSIKDDISDTYKLDGLSALISEDKVDLLSNNKYSIDLILAKKATKWNKTIESWYGELGYLFFEIECGNEMVNLQKAI